MNMWSQLFLSINPSSGILSGIPDNDDVGEYWVNVYAPKIYAAYYQGVKSAKDFLLKMDYIHQQTTKTIPNKIRIVQ